MTFSEILPYIEALGEAAIVAGAIWLFRLGRVIRRELRPNDGESMHDKVTRIDKTVEVLHFRVVNLERADKEAA